MTEIEAPKTDKATGQKQDVSKPWRVILFNDDVHSFDEVILQVQKATNCSLIEATRITLEAHQRGKAVAFKGSFSRCYSVATVLREIQLIVEIEG